MASPQVRLCLSNRSVLEKYWGAQTPNIYSKEIITTHYTILLTTSPVQLTNLLTSLTSVRLFSAVCPLVPLHVVLLNKSHVTLVAAEWLLSCQKKNSGVKVKWGCLMLWMEVFQSLTTVDLLVSLEEVLLNETHVALTASEGSFTWNETHKIDTVIELHYPNVHFGPIPV